MNLIKIQNNYSWLITEDQKLKDTFWQALKFRPLGYFFNPMYKAKKWDGFTEYFKKGTGRFLTGLLPEIEKGLQLMGVEYELNDERNFIKFKQNSINEDHLKEKLGITLRDYQVEYVNEFIKNPRSLIDSKTGSGKTNVMLAIIDIIPENYPILILCNRKSLIEQNYNEILKLGRKVGRFYGDKKEIENIICATAQSSKYLFPIADKFRVIFGDEIHLLTSDQSKKLYEKLINCDARLGLSATPFTFGDKNPAQKYLVKGWFGDNLILKDSTKDGKLTVSELQDRKILSKAKCTFYPINEPQLPYAIYTDAVTYGLAQNDYFNETVARLACSLPGRTLILVERIEHGDRLAQKIPNLLWVQGKDDLQTRQRVIEQLSNNENKVCAAATQQIFSTGINFFIHNLIMCSSQSATHNIIQIFGRGLRVKGDKFELKYFDFIFNINDYLLKHSNKRIKVLSKDHIVEIKENIDF